MSCPFNSFGQPNCYITAHPDHPSEKFCATCKQRFVEKTAWGDIVYLVMAFVFAILMLSSLLQKRDNLVESEVDNIQSQALQQFNSTE